MTRLLTFAPVKGLPGVTWHVGLSIDKAKEKARERVGDALKGLLGR